MKHPIDLIGLALLSAASTLSWAGTTAYPGMAPIARYDIADRAAEIALARSAAPAALSSGAQVLVLGKRGYETAVRGGNGFVCLVERSWDLNFNNAEFWNPKIRSPQCFNAAGAKSVLPRYLERTRWVLAGESIARMRARVSKGQKRLTPAPGSVCYMMSRQAYLNDTIAGPWHSHVMFFDLAKPADWGANLPDSPMAADATAYAPVTIFMVVVQKWSDGTPSPGMSPDSSSPVVASSR
jgi:hypothetical protein